MNYQEALQVEIGLLPQVEEALLLEGFGDGPQIWKPGQRSGLIKGLDGGFQLHFRLFHSGVIQPEREIHNRFVEHPGTSSPAIEEAIAILNKYGIPYSVVYTERYTANGHVPTSRTPWFGVVAVVVIGLVLLRAFTSRK
jgi:hypothetical protein